MERHDIWQWACIITLWFCENINEFLAILLMIMNIVWVGVRLWDWIIKRRKRNEKAKKSNSPV